MILDNNTACFGINSPCYSLVQQLNTSLKRTVLCVEFPLLVLSSIWTIWWFLQDVRYVNPYAYRWTTLSPYSGTSWFQLVVLIATYLPVDQVVVDVLAKSWCRWLGVYCNDSCSIHSSGFLLLNFSGVAVPDVSTCMCWFRNFRWFCWWFRNLQWYCC